MTPEDTVRAFYDAYSTGHPERFEELVSPDYIDYGHTPPGRGPEGARSDYEHALQITGGLPTYDLDALITRDETVAAAWTGHLPSGKDFHGLSLYRVSDGQIAETRFATIGALPV